MQYKLSEIIPLFPPYLPDYPHKYGSEGGCADHSVFERMRKYQSSAVEKSAAVKVSANITTKPLSLLHASVKHLICLHA